MHTVHCQIMILQFIEKTNEFQVKNLIKILEMEQIEYHRY